MQLVNELSNILLFVDSSWLHSEEHIWTILKNSGIQTERRLKYLLKNTVLRLKYEKKKISINKQEKRFDHLMLR